MNFDEFRKHAHELVDWMADYLENNEKYPVKSQVNPGDIIKQLPDKPPENAESFETLVFGEINRIMSGSGKIKNTHGQRNCNISVCLLRLIVGLFFRWLCDYPGFTQDN